MRVRVLGCTPRADSVRVRLARRGAAEALEMPALATADPQEFTFWLPEGLASTVDARIRVTDPACPPPSSDRAVPVSAAGGGGVFFVDFGATTLELSSLGPSAPAGGFGDWLTERTAGGSLQSLVQRFRVQTTAAADGTRWEVTLNPYAWAGDPLAVEPSSLLASGPVGCASCQFLVPFASFAPAPASAAEATWTGALTGAVFEVLDVWTAASGKAAADQGVPLVTMANQPPPSGPVATKAPLALPVPRNYYFRAVPTSGGVPVGPPSNIVRVQWSGDESVIDLSNVHIVDCTTQWQDPYCKALGYGPPPPVAYTVEILEYHGWINAKSQFEGCYVVTKTTTAQIGFTPVTYPAGQVLCEPEPDESWFEALVDWVTGAIDWASNVYGKLKAEVVAFVADALPLCDKACAGALLDAGLLALGVPPDIPNFDQLTEQGLDYLAEQAIAEAGVPGPLQDAAREQFKAGVKAGLEEMQKSYADQVGWLPDGVPVKPHPEGAHQPPASRLRITHIAGVPGDCSLSLNLDSKVVPSPATQNEANKYIPYYKSAYDHGTLDLYEQKHISVPALAPGQSLELPIVMPRPWLNVGIPGAPYYSYNQALQGWSSYYLKGDVQLRASLFGKCTQTAHDLEVNAASGSFSK